MYNLTWADVMTGACLVFLRVKLTSAVTNKNTSELSVLELESSACILCSSEVNKYEPSYEMILISLRLKYLIGIPLLIMNRLKR